MPRVLQGECSLTEAPRPYVSTGATERFIESCLTTTPEKEGLFTVSIDWKGKRISRLMGPDDVASGGDRIEAGKLRESSAEYLVRRDGNQCSIQSGFCEMGKQPFARPSSANFDHIDGNKRNHKLRNLRLACHSCNSHLQWKQKLGVASSQMGERASGTRIDLEDASAEVRINMGNRPLYRKLLEDFIQEHKEISVYNAKYLLARKLQEQTGHGSPQACANYLKTLTAGDDSVYQVLESKVRKRESK